MTSPDEEPAPGSLAPGPTRLAEPEPDPEPDPATVPAPDATCLAAARRLVQAHPELGRLREVVVWLAGAQAAAPPRPFSSPAAVVVAAAHDAARRIDGSAQSPVPARAEQVESEAMRVRVLDLASPGEWQVRPSAGDIGLGDAMTEEEALRAFALGQLAVDQEVDGGTDVLLVGDIADDNECTVAAVASVVTGREPIACVRRGTDATAWTRAVEVVRDARQRSKGLARQPIRLLACVGGPDLAALAGILVQAAARRTPALLDGAAAHVAGLVAQSYAAGSAAWWMTGSTTGHPAEALARTSLGLEPVLSLDLGFDACGGAMLAYPLVQAALHAVGDGDAAG